MARAETLRYAFNRGLISPRALGRVDLKRMALSAAIQRNWMSRSVGSMMLRPGTGYIGGIYNNALEKCLPFVASATSSAILEFTSSALRIWENDVLLARVSVAAAVVNGNFNTDLASWTDNDDAGGVSAWVAGGYMGLTGNGTAAAIRDQQISVAAPDQGKEHALRISVFSGPVTLRVGSTLGNDDYLSERELDTGTHSLAFTPGATFFIRFFSRLKREVYLDSCNIEGAGVVVLPSPYLAADLDYIRGDINSQSADELFIACKGYQQRKVEHWSDRSWSIVRYQSADGPYQVENVTGITLTPSATSGSGTLTSSAAIFKPTHARSTNNDGALFSVTSVGQVVNKSVALINDATNAMRVVGVGTDRAFAITITGFTGGGRTIILERADDSGGPWAAVPAKSWTADTAESYNDTLDNQILYYRLKLSVVGTAGATAATLQIATGSIRGVCRILDYMSQTQMSMEVLTDMGSTDASDVWSEGSWSDKRGWPTANCFYEGRYWDSGNDRLQGSVSDAYDDFDPTTEGDAGPLDRSIGSGPVATINWLLPLQRLIVGAEAAEYSVRSSALDEPLTPTNFNIKSPSTQGSAPVPAVKIDSYGLFIQKGGTRIFELRWSSESYDYGSDDISILVPEIGRPKITRIGVQRQPDTRAHFVRSDGTAAVLVQDRLESVLCFLEVDMNSYDADGNLSRTAYIEDVIVLPGGIGDEEDSVYYVVRRTVNGATVRYLEKWALETECEGGELNKQADSFISYSGFQTSTLTASHLIGEEVVVWGDGKNLGRFTVNGAGQVLLPKSVSNAVVGLHYRARFKSAKLGQTVGSQKNIEMVTPLLINTHAQGIKFGQDFDVMDNLPLRYEGAVVDPDLVYPYYDEQSQEFPGSWDTDARLCMEANAPLPACVLAVGIKGQMA